MKKLAVLLAVLLTGCVTPSWPDDVGVSIEDLEGFGNPNIEECQITFNGEVPLVPCVVEVNFTWNL